MKIAMIGHKDFPSRSGGVEVVVYELSTRLAQHGVDVTVYNRGRKKGQKKKDCVEGVHIIRSFTFKKQSLNAMVYSFTATLHAIFHRYDVIHYHAIGICVPLLLARLCGKKTVATIHGLNWRVDKWKGFAASYLKLGEKIAAKYATEVITLSDEMHRYFLTTYGRNTVQINNAILPVQSNNSRLIQEKFGLAPGSYLFYVGRISPEKGVLELIQAYNQLSLSQKLVIAGQMPNNAFGRQILEAARGNSGIVFTGFAQGEVLASLYTHCALYLLPSHTEGLSLSLLEAMSCGANCLVSNIPENAAVLKDFGRYFKVSQVKSLADSIKQSLEQGISEETKAQEIAYIAQNYNYRSFLEKHMAVYKSVIAKERAHEHS